MKEIRRNEQKKEEMIEGSKEEILEGLKEIFLLSFFFEIALN